MSITLHRDISDEHRVRIRSVSFSGGIVSVRDLKTQANHFNQTPRFGRVRQMVAYAIILGLMILGAGSAPWWFALVGGIALTAVSATKHVHVLAGLQSGSFRDVLLVSLSQSFANGCIAAGAALIAGRVLAELLV